MRDKKLVNLIIVGTILSLGHTVDHIVRGDLHWPLTWESVPFIVVSLAIYAAIALGLYLYAQGKVGARFWAIFAGSGLAFGWLAHFSPFTDQPARYIFNAHESVIAGWLALSCLLALMLTLMVAAVYAAYLWLVGDTKSQAH
jgi:hypothetical protein